jgi:hypothetical protein
MKAPLPVADSPVLVEVMDVMSNCVPVRTAMSPVVSVAAIFAT